MGNFLSSGSLFATPLPEHEHARPGSGVVHRSTREPAKSRSALASTERSQEPHLRGNIYSSSIDFRPGIGAPPDAPQVAQMRARGEGSSGR